MIVSTDDICEWLTNFQSKVNEIVGNDSIQFTMDIWKPGSRSCTLVPGKVKVVGTDAFPYLDSQMMFDGDNNLCFECYSKPGYQTKYLNMMSTHTAANKRSIPRGVSIRLAGLTTRTKENEQKSLSTLYPKVHEAMKKSGLLKGDATLPKLGTILDKRMEERMASEMRKEERKKDKRNVYLMVRHSGVWRTPLHRTANKLREKYNLKWLRVRMVYKRHQNLKEMLLGDIATKVMRDIEEAGYLKKTSKKLCHCRPSFKIDGRCPYDDQCETTGVIYKISCKCCEAFYIGKTQRSLKSRCQEHYQGTGKFLNKKLQLQRRLNEQLAPPIVDSPALSSGSIGSTNRDDSSSLNEGWSHLNEELTPRQIGRFRTPRVRPPMRSIMTRSRSRALASEPQPPPTTQPTPATGMEHLQAFISLYENNPFDSASQPINPPPVIYEDRQLEAEDSSLGSSVSSTHPANLTNNPRYQLTNQPTSPLSSLSGSEGRGGSSQSSPRSNDSMNTFDRQFRGAFGMEEHEINQLEDSARRVETYLRPMLEPEYAKITSVSNLSKHMWSHAKNMEFAKPGELYSWIRSNWKVEVLHKGSKINNMKTAGTKNCQLCMKERVELFHAFSKRSQTCKLMNSKNELYGQCSCKTRFLRLQAVGNEGTDEAID